MAIVGVNTRMLRNRGNPVRGRNEETKLETWASIKSSSTECMRRGERREGNMGNLSASLCFSKL